MPRKPKAKAPVPSTAPAPAPTVTMTKQPLKDGRSVEVGLASDGCTCIRFTTMNGSAQVVTSLKITREASEALISLMGLHGFQMPKAWALEMEMPTIESLVKSSAVKPIKPAKKPARK